MNAVRCDLLQAGVEIPMTRLCKVLGVARSTAYHQSKVERLHRPVDEALVHMVAGGTVGAFCWSRRFKFSKLPRPDWEVLTQVVLVA